MYDVKDINLELWIMYKAFITTRKNMHTNLPNIFPQMLENIFVLQVIAKILFGT